MSTEIYRPNGPNTEPIYEIGTCDFEYTKGSFSQIIGDAIRSVYRGLRLPLNLLLGAIDGNGAACPTYGLWGGSGWSGGVRGSSIDWAKSSAPCYNNSIRNIEQDSSLNTDHCYSLVDAICKTHDWRYYTAGQKYAKDSVEYNVAILKADALLLEEIASALGSGSYSVPSNENVPWALKSFEGCTFDSAESVYLTGLVPLFMAKIATVDIAGVVSAEAKEAVNSILSSITINETTFENPTDSSKKTIYSVENGFLITREESASNINAWLIDLNSDAKPVNINIAYGEGSTKAEDLFVIGENGNIRINSGIGHNEITILGATNDTVANYTFEIADGGGNDTYYLDGNFDYRLIDSEANAIYIEDENGKWVKIGALLENTENNSWESQDGSITLTDNTITLANDSTIELNTDVQPGDFGINLITLPTPPTEYNTIYLDMEDPTNTDHRGVHYGTSGSDKIIGGSGNDEVMTHYLETGNDWLIGGGGNDMVQAFGNPDDCILEGNSGVDALLGSFGSDRLFCGASDSNSDGQIDTMEQGITRGETAFNLNTTGDLVYGGDGTDFIYGSDAKDGLFGGEGNDVLVGGGGDDVIYGEATSFGVGGFDYGNWSYTVEYDAVNKTYIVQFSNMTVDVSDHNITGDDVVYAGTGNDYVDAGGGDDEIYGGSGSDTIFGDVGNDFIEGGEDDDYLFGDRGLVGETGNDYIDGGSGNDYIEGQDGNDELFGGADNDTLYGHTGNDYLDGEAGNDTLVGHGGDDVLFGGADDDYLEGDDGDESAGNDYLDGEAGNDTLMGDAGDDMLFGGDGNDYIDGYIGADYIDGGAGDDEIIGGDNADILFGGEGNDTLTGDAANVAEDDQGDDYIDGGAGANIIAGGGGNDTLYGGSGNDTIDGGDGDDYIDAGEGNNTIYSGAGNNEFSVGDGDDTIYSSDSDDYIDGKGGNNFIVAYGGNDTLYGGSGNDTIDGGDGDDYIDAGDGNNRIGGGEGENTIYAGAGDDTIQCGLESGDGSINYIDAGNGNNTIYTVFGSARNEIHTGAGNDTVSGLGYDEYIYAGEGNNNISGGNTRSEIYTGSGDDTITGGTGVNYIYAGDGDNVIYCGNQSYRNEIYAGTGNDTIYGTFGSDMLTDYIDAGDGNNIINGGIGYSGIRTGSGNDQIFGYTGQDNINAGGGDDAIDGRSGNDWIRGGDGDDIISGGSGDDYLEGGLGNDTYVFKRGDGNDTIDNYADDCATAADKIQFGADIALANLLFTKYGNDLLINISGTNDSLTIKNWFINDTCRPGQFLFQDLTSVLTPAQVDSLVETQSNYGNDAIGNIDKDGLGGSGNDIIHVSSGDRVVYGGSGNDTVYGGLGNDTVYGGSGNDTVVNGDGNNIVYGGTGNDVICDGNGDDSLFGGDGDDRLYGSEGNNIIFGGSGNDYIDTLIYGSISNDGDLGYHGCSYIDAGSGNDTIVSGADDGDIVYCGAGDDKISSYGDAGNSQYFGGVGNDELFFSGSNNIICGSDGDDRIFFNVYYRFNDQLIICRYGYNYFDGGTGNDNIFSAGGNDTIFGGDGDDCIDVLSSGGYGYNYIDTGLGNDCIFSGGVGYDTIYSGAGDDSISFYNDPQNHIQCGGNYIDGDLDNDTIEGTFCDDTIIGGSGNDNLYGDAGSDIYIFGPNFGQDSVFDSDGNSDVIMFNSGISSVDITPGLYFSDSYGYSLMLSLVDTDDTLLIKGFFEYTYRIEQIQFADGIIWNIDSICSQLQLMTPTQGNDFLYGTDRSDSIQGLGGDDIIYGNQGDDTIDGGGGNDSMSGFGGNDTYVFGRGYGQVEIFDSDETLDNMDTILLNSDILPGDVKLNANEGGDLILSINGTEDTLKIWYFFLNASCEIEKIQFANGTVWDINEIYSQELEATEDDDYLYGTNAEELIHGLGGNDIIYGGDGNDTLDGDAGEDYLAGGSGNDTYIFNSSNGSKIIDDLALETEGNILLFGEGITPNDLYVTIGSLDILLGDGIDAIRFENFDPNDAYGAHAIEDYVFTDGTFLTYNQLLDLGIHINGTADNDEITGTNAPDRIKGLRGDDVICGGIGKDTIDGGDGNDTYLFNIGDGIDIVIDTSTIVEENVICFGEGIASGDLTFTKNGNTLTINVGSNGDVINLLNFDQNEINGSLVVRTLQFADYSQINLADIEIAETNNPPTVGNFLAEQTTFEDELFTFTVPANTFNDVDAGDALIYSATLTDGLALPSWLTFDTTTQTFSGTPTNDDVGTLSLKVTATDLAGASVSSNFDLTIANVNDAPVVVNPIVNQTATEDAVFNFTVPANTFNDVDAGDTLTFSAKLSDGTALPFWLIFDAATQTFSGTPGNNDVGRLSLKVTATDTEGASVSDDFNLTVINVNDAPVVVCPVANQTTFEDEVSSFTVPANTFADVDVGDALTYSATLSDGSVLPSWLAFDAATMTFSGTPANDNVGTLSLKVTATDTAGASVSDDFDVTVENGNDVPIVVNTIANQTTLEDEVFTFTVPTNTFTDVDVDDSLTYSATLADGSAPPSWLTFDADTMTFSGVPTNDDAGTLSLKVTATDTTGANISDDFDVTVVNVNDAPVVAHQMANQTATEDVAFNFMVPANTFTDVDAGDALIYSATLADGSALPSWLTFDAATMTFSGTPGNDNVGTLSLKVTATDTSGASVSDDFDITVENMNDAPFIVNPIVNQTATEDAVFNFTVPANTFNDVDAGDTLTFSAKLSDGTALPFWLTFDAATQTFSGTPTCTGKISVKVTATDTAGASVSDTFDLDIKKVTYGTNCCDFIVTCCDNDLIYALSGIDTVYSGAGDDIIYGGNCSDFLFGECGNDLIYGENDNDNLYGGSGNDTLDGGTGADDMIGGSGNDTYIVDKLPSGLFNLIPGDTVTEYYNDGMDTVESSVTYTLGSNVENLTLTGTSRINGTGNSLNNVLTGNGVSNTLTGNYGNDTLGGGAGNDILNGGLGSDTYLFGNADGLDTINEISGIRGDIDALKLTEAATTDPVIVKQGNDLYVFMDADNYMKIAGEFQQANYGIERLEVSDGHYITRNDIQTIVDTLSAINNSGMDVIQKYNAMMNDEQYQNILATSWQQ